MEQMLRFRLHKARIIKAGISSSKLYTLGQDHHFCEYDMVKNLKTLSVDLKTGALDLSINYREEMAAVSKLNGSINFYSIADGRKLPLTIDVSERAESQPSAISWIGTNHIAVGMADGALLLYDIRKPNIVEKQSQVDGKINRIVALNDGSVLALSSRLDFFDMYLRHESSLVVDPSWSSLYAAFEDRSRRAIVVAGFDQKLHVVRPKVYI